MTGPGAPAARAVNQGAKQDPENGARCPACLPSLCQIGDLPILPGMALCILKLFAFTTRTALESML